MCIYLIFSFIYKKKQSTQLTAQLSAQCSLIVSGFNYWAGNFTKKLVWFHSCYPYVFIFNSMSLFKTQGIIIAVLFICDYYCLGNFS